MSLIIVMILIGAGFFFAWRHSPSQPKRVAADIGGVLAAVFILIGIYGVVVYFQTATP